MVLPAPPDPVQRFEFAAFALDVGAGELSRNGTRVRLQDRPFQLLAARAEKCGEVATREELRHRLWPDATFVDSDHSISSAIKKRRSTPGDRATQPRYIATV